MRRLAHRLFMLCSAVSLLLCVLAIGLMLLPAPGTVVVQWNRPDGYGVEAVSYGETLFVYHGRVNRALTIVMLSVLAVEMAVLPLL